jgi:V8-like Glu-specific endopeptidase
MGHVACGPKDKEIPKPKITCGKAAYARPSSVTAGQSSRLLAKREDIAQARQAIEDTNEHTEYTVAPETFPTVVQIRFHIEGGLFAWQSGVIVGDHSVLTAVHGFLQHNYERVTVAFTPTAGSYTGVIVETEPIRYFLHPEYVQRFYGTQRDRGWAGDVALLHVAINFRHSGIEHDRLVRDYIPPCDSNGCPIEAFTLMGWGTRGGLLPAGGPNNLELRGIGSVPLNSAYNIAQTGLMTYNHYIQPGDSGGPMYRFNPETARFEVVGLLLGGDPLANQQYEVNPTGRSAGNNQVSVTTTVRQADLDELRELAIEWQTNSQGNPFGPAVQYPRPAQLLPNNRPNPTYTSYPAFGPAGRPTPLFSTRYEDGYFVGAFPFPTPTEAHGSCE